MNGIQGMIIYPPNGAEIGKIIYVVPMRIPPRIEIEFDDLTYRAEKIESKSSCVVTRFIVKNKYNQKIPDTVLIKSDVILTYFTVCLRARRLFVFSNTNSPAGSLSLPGWLLNVASNKEPSERSSIRVCTGATLNNYSATGRR
jgi:hypothetical protein